MCKNKQILIFSGIGLAVLGGVASLLLLTAPAPEPEETDPSAGTEDTALILTEKSPGDVLGLHISNTDGEYDIVPSGETNADGAAVWTVAGLEKANLRTSELSAAVTNAAALTARDFVEENAELEKYGLSEPKSTVTVRFSDGTDYTFRIGDDVPGSSSAAYFYAEENDTVYTYTKSKLNAFLNDRFGFIETQVMPASDNAAGEEILSFKVERSDLDEPILIEQIPPSDDPDELAVFSYQMITPYAVYLDLTNGPVFLQSLFGLTAQRAAWYGMEERDYELSGLNDPTAVITVETTKKTYTLTLGGAVGKEVTDENGKVTTEITGIYGMSSEVPDTLFLFDESAIPALSVRADALISKLFLMPYIYSLREVTYKDHLGQEFAFSFEKTKDATETEPAVYRHLLNGEETDEQRLKNLYQFMISATGDELYFGDEEDELLAEIHYIYSDENRGENIVKFYSAKDDRRVIVNVNGKNLFKTKQIYMSRLYENVESF